MKQKLSQLLHDIQTPMTFASPYFPNRLSRPINNAFHGSATTVEDIDSIKRFIDQFDKDDDRRHERVRREQNGQYSPVSDEEITTKEGKEPMGTNSTHDSKPMNIVNSAGDGEGGQVKAVEGDQDKVDREAVYKEMKPFIGMEELEKLSDDELKILQRNVGFGEDLNVRFCRSPYYPLSRDLSFAPEKPLFQKWASGRQNLVEIGVFEGASSLNFRRAMSSNGVLHLIDPYVIVPDSKLTARPWMARLNLLRSSNGEVRWYRDYSYNVVKDWTKSVDFLFVDGDHSERATRDDWLLWHSFVDVAGVVLFHDARFGKGDGTDWDGWPGPARVVDQLFRNLNKLPNWEIVDEAGSLVVVKRIY